MELVCNGRIAAFEDEPPADGGSTMSISVICRFDTIATGVASCTGIDQQSWSRITRRPERWRGGF
jgi:hypothetical protein